MKIAIVIEHFDASRGGAERLAGWVAREMARRGHDVHVICHDMAARVSRYRQATLRASFDAHRSRRALGTAFGMQVTEPPADAPATASVDPSGAKALPAAAPWRVHVHTLKGMRLHTALGLRLFGRRARALCRRGAGGRFDVVHSFTAACPGDLYQPQAGVYAAMQAQVERMRRPEAGGAWRRIWQRLPGRQRTLLALERRALEGRHAAGWVISNCAMMTGQFALHYGLPAGRVVTLPTPRLEEGTQEKETGRQGDKEGGGAEARAARQTGDRAWFRGHYGLAETDRVALFVGHDFRRKGLREAIEAVARTAGWKLVVVGLGKVREYVELAQELGLMAGEDPGDTERGRQGDKDNGARVLFVGPTRELGAIYAAADALVLPAFYEPSGVVVLEALGHGVPVVCSAFVGAADLVAEYEAGAVVADPQDVAALAAALEALPAAGTTAARELAQRAGAAAGSLSPQGFADRLEALYRQVVQASGR